MTYTVTLPDIGTDAAWRDAARRLVTNGIPPEEVVWTFGPTQIDDMFSHRPLPPARGTLHVPRNFVQLINSVIWHSDPERFARCYAMLWRLRDHPHSLSDRGNPEATRLFRLAKAVQRDKHKMTAFLRFREVGEQGPRRRFAAWFEPSHYILEPTTEFFARRFGDMDWVILTPHLTATFESGKTTLSLTREKPDLPEDATEDLWRTYFRNIFNPARLKIQAMQSEMPKKYWKNMPEAELIPELIADAERRASEMAAAAPTLPPLRAERISARLTDACHEGDLATCQRCPLHSHATQAVPGIGPLNARIMVVGEQPGDMEDRLGRPFVGPAGRLFDDVAAEVGLDRGEIYVTNAVKHFKFSRRGKRRIHQRPNAGEIAQCLPWLKQEIRQVRPALIVALGATAAEALTGSGQNIAARRGKVERGKDGVAVFLTYHPSYFLRRGDDAATAKAQFRDDLARVARSLQDAPPGRVSSRAS